MIANNENKAKIKIVYIIIILEIFTLLKQMSKKKYNIYIYKSSRNYMFLFWL